MGVIISRFLPKKTTTEVLEKLDRNIRSIKERGQRTQLQHRRVIANTTRAGVGIYLLVVILYYCFYYFEYSNESPSWLQAVMYASPLLLLPVLVLMIRSCTSRYYNQLLNQNRSQLRALRDKKNKILEEVMNTENYNVAKGILDKYADPEAEALMPSVPRRKIQEDEEFYDMI